MAARMTRTGARCPWAGDDPLMVRYHDEEWGRPVHDDRVLFEFLILEGAQAGLSWSTILNKRAGYQRAFAGFDPASVATFGDDDVARLMGDAGIVRNRLKITSTIDNARVWVGLDDPVGLLWSFVDGRPIQHDLAAMGDVPATTPESDRMSKALKKLGFRFVGSTICYALMQATGMVNDHLVSCPRHAQLGGFKR